MRKICSIGCHHGKLCGRTCRTRPRAITCVTQSPRPKGREDPHRASGRRLSRVVVRRSCGLACHLVEKSISQSGAHTHKSLVYAGFAFEFEFEFLLIESIPTNLLLGGHNIRLRCGSKAGPDVRAFRERTGHRSLFYLTGWLG